MAFEPQKPLQAVTQVDWGPYDVPASGRQAFAFILPGSDFCGDTRGPKPIIDFPNA